MASRGWKGLTKGKFLSISNKLIRELFNNDVLTADVTYCRIRPQGNHEWRPGEESEDGSRGLSDGT